MKSYRVEIDFGTYIAEVKATNKEEAEILGHELMEEYNFQPEPCNTEAEEIEEFSV